MPLIDRDTVVDRPTILDRSKDSEANNENQAETLGSGGGPTINGIEFEEGDLDIVAASNGAAVLATGTAEGEVFHEAFLNSASQLKQVKDAGEDIDSLVEFAVDRGVADLGMTDEDVERFKEQMVEEPTEPEDNEEIEADEETEDIEEELEEVSDTEEDETDNDEETTR